MKKLLLLIIFNFSFLIVNCYSQQYGWVDIASNIPDFPNDTLYNISGDTIVAGLMNLSFISDNEGWIVTANGNNQGGGAVLHTTDGGQSWSVSAIQTNCIAIQMLNQNMGYAGGQSGIIWKTTDSGITWNYHGTIGNAITDIEFPPQPADTGYASGLEGSIGMISPAGITSMQSGIVGHVDDLSFPETKDEGWFVGEGWGMIRHFINGLWTPDQIHISGYHNGVDFVDNQNGWAVGDRILHTTDGQTWNEQTNPDTLGRVMLDVFFLNANEGWIVGNQGLILQTTNGGTIWTLEANGLNNTLLTGVQFTSSTNGYITGNNKTLLKYTQLTSVEDEAEKPLEFSLHQNYPNPFNPSTKIRFEIPGQARNDNALVTIKVYDVLGNEIATLVNEEKPAGTYEVEFQSSVGSHQLASGIYFYKLTAGNYIQIKKMVIIK
jgi:photosystem II stability/assembly factor-like uncharacterized protein